MTGARMRILRVVIWVLTAAFVALMFFRPALEIARRLARPPEGIP